MTAQLSELPQGMVVTVTGEVDLHTSPMLRVTLLQALATKRPVVVNLAETAYIDSSGVACLVEGLQVARSQGSPFILAAVSAATLRVLRLARLDRVFSLTDDVSAAWTQMESH